MLTVSFDILSCPSAFSTSQSRWSFIHAMNSSSKPRFFLCDCGLGLQFYLIPVTSSTSCNNLAAPFFNNDSCWNGQKSETQWMLGIRNSNTLSCRSPCPSAFHSHVCWCAKYYGRFLKCPWNMTKHIVSNFLLTCSSSCVCYI